MKTYPLNEARAEFSKLVERALAGEPQRVTAAPQRRSAPFSPSARALAY